MNLKNYINTERIDIMAKLIYAKLRELKADTDFGLNLYKEHIKVFNGGWEHPGTKTSVEQFVSEFNDLIDNMKVNGFDSRFPIPVGENNVLQNGIHRFVASLINNVTPEFVLRKTDTTRYDYIFFRNHKEHSDGLDDFWLDQMILEYCNIKENLYAVNLFPSANKEHDKVIEILNNNGKIVYDKFIELNDNGALNLMIELYRGEQWAGNFHNDFLGARQKKSLCFTNNSPMRLFIFECNDINTVRQVKKEIRDIYRIENHSVHINDNKEELLRIVRALLNKNSIHFLNTAKQKPFNKFFNYLNIYSKDILNNINKETVCIDSSAVLSVYGLRDCQDIDFLSLLDVKTNSDIVSCHNSWSNHYTVKKDDIIFDPNYHFYFAGIKFASLDVVRQMKLNRAEEKDKSDIKLIGGILDD